MALGVPGLQMSNFDTFLQSFQSKSVSANASSFVEAEYSRMDSNGLYFTVKSWDGGKHVFGPAPWTVTTPAPVSGDRVLVLFLGAGVERPWVLGWWPS